MKRILSLLISCVCIATSISAQDREFTINGKFPSSMYDGQMVYLQQIDYKNNNDLINLDSVIVKNSTFELTGDTDLEIKLRYLSLKEDPKVSALIVLEPGVIAIEMKDVPTMSGTPKNKELDEFTASQIAAQVKLEEILQGAQRLHQSDMLDAESSERMESEFAQQQQTLLKTVFTFVSRNMVNEIGEFFFTIYAPNLRPSELEILFANSKKDFQESILPQTLMRKHVWSLGEFREGKPFKGIEMKSQKGETEDIGTHFGRGKVVLVDFWASWCGPCRKSMPIVVKLYDRYKESGFEIVGISLDENEASWKSAIKSMRMEWPQYIDNGGGWQGVAARHYNVSRIPQTYLLDKKGNIAAHDLSGIKLIEKIEELLKEE